MELCKLRIVTMVLVTCAVGYLIAAMGSADLLRLALTLLGTGLSVAGSGALNNYLEREVDARMDRTRHRALPSGRIAPASALSLGTLLVLSGVVILAWFVSLLPAFLVLLASFLYVLVYTPMKRLTWLNTAVGAIPGAIPPMVGWAACTGRLDAGAWVLFAVLYAWQHPHFYAIAWMYRDDYARGGFKMLPVVDPSGRRTFRQVWLFSLALVAMSLMPALMGLTGWVYLAGCLVLGAVLLRVGHVFSSSGAMLDARRLLRASIIYLPCWLVLTLADLSF